MVDCYFHHQSNNFNILKFIMIKVIDRISAYTTNHKIFFYLCITIGIISAGVLYYRFNPNSTPLFPKCLFLTLTGMKCPGCGSQRAIHALLHADIPTAFSYNALMVSSIPYLILLVGVRIYQRFKPHTMLLLKVQKSAYIWFFFTVVIIFSIARNIFNF